MILDFQRPTEYTESFITTSYEYQAGKSLLLVHPLIFLIIDDYDNDDDDEINNIMIIFVTQ
jgi:hypothetical protein